MRFERKIKWILENDAKHKDYDGNKIIRDTLSLFVTGNYKEKSIGNIIQRINEKNDNYSSRIGPMYGLYRIIKNIGVYRDEIDEEMHNKIKRRVWELYYDNKDRILPRDKVLKDKQEASRFIKKNFDKAFEIIGDNVTVDPQQDPDPFNDAI